MANKRTRDLNTEATYDGDAYIQIDKDSYAEAKKQKLSVAISNELSGRQAADNAIIAGAGLSVGGSYTTDDTTNYLKSTDFVAAGLTPSLKNADKLIDAKIYELNADFVVSGLGLRYYAPPAVITSLDWSSKLLYDIPDLSSLILLQTLYLQSNSLTTVTIPNTLTALEILDLRSNALTIASVDAVLLNLDTSGVLNGTVDLSGGTNASPTGGAANVNKLSLEGKGWTVLIN